MSIEFPMAVFKSIKVGTAVAGFGVSRKSIAKMEGDCLLEARFSAEYSINVWWISNKLEVNDPLELRATLSSFVMPI